MPSGGDKIFGSSDEGGSFGPSARETKQTRRRLSLKKKPIKRPKKKVTRKLVTQRRKN